MTRTDTGEDVPEILSTAEVARELGISHTTLFKKIYMGKIRCFKINPKRQSHWYFWRTDVDEYITKQNEKAKI